jgi:hypothetical protein
LAFVVAILFIWFLSLPYIAVDILVRIFGHAIYGKRRIDSVILEKLNEMYFKSMIEVAPYINHEVLQNVFSQSRSSRYSLP